LTLRPLTQEFRHPIQMREWVAQVALNLSGAAAKDQQD